MSLKKSYRFMPVNIINLNRSKDRLSHMSRQCYEYCLPFVRHPAVDGNEHVFTDQEIDLVFELAHNKYKNMKMHHRNMFTVEENVAHFNTWDKDPAFKKTKRLVSCSLSHIQVWNTYRTTKDPYIMILEDDGKLKRSIRNDVAACVEHLDAFDPEWHIIWLSGKDPENRERILTWNSYTIYRMDPPKYIGQGAGAYILSRKGIEHFLKAVDRNGCNQVADFLLFENLDVRHAYGVDEPIVDIHSSRMRSTIL